MIEVSVRARLFNCKGLLDKSDKNVLFTPRGTESNMLLYHVYLLEQLNVHLTGFTPDLFDQDITQLNIEKAWVYNHVDQHDYLSKCALFSVYNMYALTEDEVARIGLILL